MQYKKRVLNLLLAALFLVCGVIFVNALREIVPQMEEYRAAEREYQEIRAIARAPRGTYTAAEAPAQPQPPPQEEESVEPDIDWEALRAINPDIVGWIVLDGTPIDYPIVRGRDNDMYLHQTFTGERNVSGAIFMDYRNAPDFSDPFTLIHGHNMQNGSMFAGLHDFMGTSFRIYTPSGVLEFEVFTKRIVAADDELYSFPPQGEGGRRAVTLSTCVSRRGDLRLIVQGVRRQEDSGL